MISSFGRFERSETKSRMSCLRLSFSNETIYNTNHKQNHSTVGHASVTGFNLRRYFNYRFSYVLSYDISRILLFYHYLYKGGKSRKDLQRNSMGSLQETSCVSRAFALLTFKSGRP